MNTPENPIAREFRGRYRAVIGGNWDEGCDFCIHLKLFICNRPSTLFGELSCIGSNTHCVLPINYLIPRPTHEYAQT